jgi:hypothetical protein
MSNQHLPSETEALCPVETPKGGVEENHSAPTIDQAEPAGGEASKWRRRRPAPEPVIRIHIEECEPALEQIIAYQRFWELAIARAIEAEAA